jgi:outer membrane receptor for ferrienterochelin and colicins
LGGTYWPNRSLGGDGGLSAIKLAKFSSDSVAMLQDLNLNVPEVSTKGSVTVSGLGFDNYFVRLAGRFRTAFPYTAGYWDSNVFLADDNGKLASRVVADLSGGYTFEHGVTVRGFIKNMFNNKTPDVLGAPIPGRLGYVQLEDNFEGLRL